MRYYLSDRLVLKRLESPCIYNVGEDELYELDEAGFNFLLLCSGPDGREINHADRAFVDYCISEGILTTKKTDIKRPPVIASPIPSLRYLEFQITDKCNLRCGHCYVGEPQGREISISHCKAVLDEFELLQGLRLLITGGEPLMHSCFSEFNRLLPGYAFRKILFTNGLMVDREVVKELNVDELQISIDGMEHGHDAVRGKGSFRKALKGAKEALEAGMPVSVATMVHRENLLEFDEMERLFRRLGIRDWTVDVPCPEGRLRDNDTLLVDPETGGMFFKYGFGNGLHDSAEGFGCGLHLASVLAGAEVCKCAFYRSMPAGNINEGLASAWKRIKPIPLKDLDCARASCAVLEECRGGCRYRASAISGDPKATNHAVPGRQCDPYKCFYYGMTHAEL